VVKKPVYGILQNQTQIDLSGIDVARKTLILIRESGYKGN
jgi:homoserine dehydrogenase